MKFFLLVLLVGGVSALHLNENLPKDVEITRPEVEECPPGEELLPLEEEEGSGSGGAPGDEGDFSDQDVTDENLQCPKEEDTVNLVANSGCKTCRYLLVRNARRFGIAQSICRSCYRGTLTSIHSFRENFQITSCVTGLNQDRVWIGGRVVGRGHCKRFQWVDGSPWNFTYWAAGQPCYGDGRCVSLCTQGGHWRLSHCQKRLPFICSY